MTGRVIKRSVSIAGHRTSISLEEAFWVEIRSLASARGQSVAGLIAWIDGERSGTNLSSALRVHVLESLKSAVSKQERLNEPHQVVATDAHPPEKRRAGVQPPED